MISFCTAKTSSHFLSKKKLAHLVLYCSRRLSELHLANNTLNIWALLCCYYSWALLCCYYKYIYNFTILRINVRVHLSVCPLVTLYIHYLLHCISTITIISYFIEISQSPCFVEPEERRGSRCRGQYTSNSTQFSPRLPPYWNSGS